MIHVCCDFITFLYACLWGLFVYSVNTLALVLRSRRNVKKYHHDHPDGKNTWNTSYPQNCFLSFLTPTVVHCHRHEWLTFACVREKMHYHNKTEWRRRTNICTTWLAITVVMRSSSFVHHPCFFSPKIDGMK